MWQNPKMWFSCIQLFTNCRNKASKHQLPEVKTSTGGSTLYQKAIIQSQTGSSIHNGNKFPKQKGQLLINCLLSASLLWMEAVWKVSFWQGRLLKGKEREREGPFSITGFRYDWGWRRGYWVYQRKEFIPDKTSLIPESILSIFSHLSVLWRQTSRPLLWTSD